MTSTTSNLHTHDFRSLGKEPWHHAFTQLPALLTIHGENKMPFFRCALWRVPEAPQGSSGAPHSRRCALPRPRQWRSASGQRRAALSPLRRRQPPRPRPRRPRRQHQLPHVNAYCRGADKRGGSKRPMRRRAARTARRSTARASSASAARPPPAPSPSVTLLRPLLQPLRAGTLPRARSAAPCALDA